jgi:hypothetical protein
MRVSLPIRTVGTGAAAAFGQHLAGGIAEAHHEIGRDRRFAHEAANTIRTEIFACHSVLPFH